MKDNTDLSVEICLISMRFDHEVVDRAVELLLSSVGRTEGNPECQACTVARDAADVHKVCYREMWNSKAAFLRHLETEEFRRVLVVMDMCCEEPHVMIGNLSGHSGMSYLLSMLKRNSTVTLKGDNA